MSDFGAPSAPGSPSPSNPEKKSKFGIIVVVLIGLLLIALAWVVFFPKGKPGRSAPTASSSPSQQPVDSSAMDLISGTVSYQGKCIPVTLQLSVENAAGASLGSVALKTEASGSNCSASFSAKVHRADEYNLGLAATLGSRQPIKLVGPRYTRPQLEQLGFKLDLSLQEFGDDTPEGRIDSELQNAIYAAHSYFDEHKSYAGLTADEMQKLAPNLVFNQDPKVTEGEISLRVADSKWVMFAGVRSDGTPVVIGASAKIVCYGQIDASTVKQCIAWQPKGVGSSPGAGAPSPPSQL